MMVQRCAEVRSAFRSLPCIGGLPALFASAQIAWKIMLKSDAWAIVSFPFVAAIWHRIAGAGNEAAAWVASGPSGQAGNPPLRPVLVPVPMLG
jgi:hypothetical protein